MLFFIQHSGRERETETETETETERERERERENVYVFEREREQETDRQTDRERPFINAQGKMPARKKENKKKEQTWKGEWIPCTLHHLGVKKREVFVCL